MTGRRVLAAMAVLIGSGVLLSATPASGGPTEVEFLLSKQKEPDYVGVIGLNVRPGKTKAYFLRVRSSGPELGAVFFGDPDAPFKVRYFKLSGKEITAKANSSEGFGFTIGDGHTLRLRGTIKLPGGADPGTGGCSSPEVDWFDGSVFVNAYVNLNEGLC